MIKEMKLNDYFGETINIEEATMVSIVHTKANTTNDEYQAGEHDHVQIEIQCDDAPNRAGGINKKSILKKPSLPVRNMTAHTPITEKANQIN